MGEGVGAPTKEQGGLDIFCYHIKSLISLDVGLFCFCAGVTFSIPVCCGRVGRAKALVLRPRSRVD